MCLMYTVGPRKEPLRIQRATSEVTEAFIPCLVILATRLKA